MFITTPKYIRVLAENIIFNKKKMEKEKTNTNTIYNSNLPDVYEIFISEILNSLQQGQYKIVDDWNKEYTLRLHNNIDIEISLSEDTIRSIRIESSINKPDLPTSVQDQIIETLKNKTKEDEILELEVKVAKLNKQIQQLKGKY